MPLCKSSLYRIQFRAYVVALEMTDLCLAVLAAWHCNIKLNNPIVLANVAFIASSTTGICSLGHSLES
ncbi:hypothetical protein [Scytonema sp. PCC 10023]|uniref:hypothetical protein n=1 Tax=Scytonema sp. PCC 10023 TaxID=1680591 RepID=UPI0039C7515A